MDRVQGPYTEQYHPAYRTGVVYQVESAPPYRVRVLFPDRDGIISWWLPVCFPKTQEDKFFWQPDIGEQVVCLMDEHDENGCVLGSVPSTVDAPPAGLTPDQFYIQFKDGTILQYNRASHQLSISLTAGGAASISQAAGGLVELDGAGNVTVQAASSVSFQQGGAAAGDALALVSKLVTAFNEHTHPYGSRAEYTDVPTIPWDATTVGSTLVKVSN